MGFLEEKIISGKSLIMCEVAINEDVFNSPLKYLAGDFSLANLPNFVSLNDVFDHINPKSEACEAFGYEVYRLEMKKMISECIKNGGAATIILPLMDNVSKSSFIGSISKDKNCLNVVFFHIPFGFVSSNLDSLLASKYKDQLTGLFNRSTLENHLKKNTNPGYICLFDLNKFKAINDTYGHSVGDNVLTLLSSYLIAISSNEEIFYRISGDEFMIFFLKPDIEYALKLINKIDTYLLELHEGPLKQYKDLYCSASFGLLELQYPNGKQLISMEDEIKLADLAMYQAKGSKKQYHIITHEDALLIISSGKLEERLHQIAVQNGRK